MSAPHQTLLVELLAEELPPKALKRLGDAFAHLMEAGLREQGLLADGAAVTPFATPRRLAVQISHVIAQAPDKAVEHKLMPVSVGLDAQGAATAALRKKLVALGAGDVTEGQLTTVGEGKAQALVWRTTARGVSLTQGLQLALDRTLAALPIPKVMQYQLLDGWQSVSFVRPVHGLVALYGTDVVKVSALGLESGRQTRGHRFESVVDPVAIPSAECYAEQLESQGSVLASFKKRRDEIVRQLTAAAAGLKEAGADLKLTPIKDDALLDEVTGLVERPNVLVCSFETSFLDVPPECLILTMKANQKYFPLLDAKGALTRHFLVVSNICPSDPSRIIEGNQRVVRPRLADAKFFFDKDRKATLASRLPLLDKVVYHAKLGSMGDRVARVRAIAKNVGQQLGGLALAQQADRAAELAKCDLVTDMVGEFPELQGVMGGYYARHDGEDEAVAAAVEDHYKPRFAGDTLPRSRVGAVAALADKLETLVGLFGAGEKPTGDKDPFALRRHALGVIRLLQLDTMAALSLPDLLKSTITVCGLQVGDTNIHQALHDFIFDRLRVSLGASGDDLLDAHQAQPHKHAIVGSPKRWFDAAQIESVLALRPPHLAEVRKRLEAVQAFAVLPEAQPLAAANKRVGNILKKSDGAGAQRVKPTLLHDAAERSLHDALVDLQPKADAHFDRGDYAESLRVWAALKGPVDAFFEAVMVNTEDAALRNNRLALLARLHVAMNRVADLSKLAV